MEVLDVITLLITMAAIFLAVNVKFLKMPTTIGLMILAMVMSVVVIGAGAVFPGFRAGVTQVMTEYQFADVLFKVMLNFLLFAGALEVNLRTLGEEKLTVFVLAMFGTLLSTFVVAGATYFVLPLLGLNIDFIYCLLFGALISPTDPIAVLAMIKNYQVSKNLQTQISGESLFNDGLGVVVFLTVLAVAKEGTASFDLGETGMLFVEEVFGGIILGLIIGLLGLWMLKWIDNKHTEIEVLITLSMVMGGSLLAHMWHFSAPLAMVVMGLTVGREGRDEALAEATGEYVYKFWHLTDEALNAILFILIGLQILLVEWAPKFVMAAIIAIPIVLGARFLGTGTPITLLRTKKTIHRLTVRVLTWGGLRGGISVALALSLRETLPEVYETERMVIDAIIAMTYSVVAFSIIVQGLTVGRIFDQIQADEEARNAAA